MLPFRRLHLWVLASLIVIVAMLQFLTVNGVLGREGRSRPSLPDHLEMPLPAKWTELSHSTWTCTEELEEQEVDRALVALDNSSGSEARAKLEAEKASIQRRKQCIVKNMCVDGNGNSMRRSKTLLKEQSLKERKSIVRTKKEEAEKKVNSLSPFDDETFSSSF